MSDSVRKGNEEKARAMREKTSFASYSAWKFEGMLISVTGAISGYWLAGEKRLGKFVPEQYKTRLSSTTISWIGAFIGLQFSGIANGYRHWKKTETEAQRIGNINDDVAHAMGERGRFAETLSKQENYIKELISQRQESHDKPHAENINNITAIDMGRSGG